MSIKKILITGSKGFIGSRIVKEFSDRGGYDIVEYDIVDGLDICNAVQLDRVFAKENFDAVIHLAALAGVVGGEKDRISYINVNILGTENIVECCRKYGVKLLFFSSSSVLGGNKDIEYGLRESDPYNPIGIYGLSKMWGEYFVKNSDIKYTIVRPFSVYGEGGRHDMVIYKWLDQIKRRGKITVYGKNTIRGYTYVGDVSKAIFDLISNNIFNNDIIHIGGNEKITIENLLTLLRKTVDKCGVLFDSFDDVTYKPLSHYDVPVSFADTSRAERIIGFKPEHLFEKRVEKIILEYFKK